MKYRVFWNSTRQEDAQYAQSSNIQDSHPTCSNVWKWDLGTEKGWAELARKNRDENVEMDDGNKEDWEDQEWRNMSKSLTGKIREASLRWLRHVERKTEEDVVMRTWKMEVVGHRKIGRPKLRWSDVIRKYMNETWVTREEAQYLRIWTIKTWCADPK